MILILLLLLLLLLPPPFLLDFIAHVCLPICQINQLQSGRAGGRTIYSRQRSREITLTKCFRARFFLHLFAYSCDSVKEYRCRVSCSCWSSGSDINASNQMWVCEYIVPTNTYRSNTELGTRAFFFLAPVWFGFNTSGNSISPNGR